MPADLHLHTTFSDGRYSPEELVKAVSERGLTTIAITDHDEIDGIERAIQAGKKFKVEVIPGVEFSTNLNQIEVHVLGYFIDYRANWFVEKLREMAKARSQRINSITEKLSSLGVKIDPKRVLQIAGHGTAGRPHVAEALVEAGHVQNQREAFARYLSLGAPGYVGHYRLSPASAIELIHKVHGLAILAHPGSNGCDQIIPELLQEGLDGIEVYYSGHNEAETMRYLRLAQKYGLLVTGGSDFHGPGIVRDVELGSVKIKDGLVERLKKAHEKI